MFTRHISHIVVERVKIHILHKSLQNLFKVSECAEGKMLICSLATLAALLYVLVC